jgi:hypothetical protein
LSDEQQHVVIRSRVEPVRVVAGAFVPLLVGALVALGVLFAGG